MHGHNDNIHAGANSPPVGRGPFQKVSSMKTRSGELPRRQASTQTGGLSPQASGGSFPHAQQTPFSHSSSWGPRGTPHGAAQRALASASSGPLGYRAAPPATPPQQPVQEPPAAQQVSPGSETPAISQPPLCGFPQSHDHKSACTVCSCES